MYPKNKDILPKKLQLIPLPASPTSPLPSAPPSSLPSSSSSSAPSSSPPSSSPASPSSSSSSLVNLKFQPPRWYRHNNNPRRCPGEICWQHEEICEQVNCTLRRTRQLPEEGEEIRGKKIKEKQEREEKMEKALDDQMEHLRHKRICKMKNKKNKKNKNKNKKKLRRMRKLEEEEVCGIPQHLLKTWFSPEQIASWATPQHPPEEDEYWITPEQEEENEYESEQEKENEYEDEWLPPAQWTVQEGKISLRFFQEEKQEGTTSSKTTVIRYIFLQSLH